MFCFHATGKSFDGNNKKMGLFSDKNEAVRWCDVQNEYSFAWRSQVSVAQQAHHLFKEKSGSKKSPTGPTEQTPKPEYPIALATYLGVRW